MIAVTGLYAGLLLLLAIALILRVIDARRSEQVSLGDGDNEVLAVRIRGHANLVENAPLFLIVLGVLEFNGASPILLHFLGILFLVSRILHAIGLSKPTGVGKYRYYGTLGTLIVMLAAAVYLVVQSLMGINLHG
ncbi:MAG: MAPEG family protein [Rhizobiaceae bacterium]